MKKMLSALLSLALVCSLSAAPAAALEVEQARELLRTYYVDPIPEDILALPSVDAILDALGDPYTVYYSAEEYQRFLTAVNGETVVGIGVALQAVYRDGFQIESILPDSPALEAGLQVGDRILYVDGTQLSETSNIIALISGREGTQVTLTLYRPSEDRLFTCTIPRRTVQIPIVTHSQVGTAGLINCSSFGDSTMDGVEQALVELGDHTSVWIMDLRTNSGGNSQDAAGTAGLFAGGATMVYFRDSTENYHYIFTAATFPDLTDKPLILLTSPNTASAAELFSGAARDLGFGISLGQRTFGKGIAQIVFDESNTDQDMFHGDALKITTYRFFSPDGTTTQITGILPALLISQKNTASAALLLSAPEPPITQREDHLKLSCNSFTFYINLNQAMEADNRAAFTELLEAIPPAFFSLQQGSGSIWEDITPQALAAQLNLPFVSRYDFSDLEDPDLALRVRTLAAYDLVSGYEDGSFRPHASITRGEFCALVANALALPAGSASLPFSDTRQDAWYTPYVSAMTEMGFLDGYEDHTFRPNQTISYQEVVTVLSSISSWLTMKGYEISKQGLAIQDWAKFYAFDEWARTHARNLSQLGFDVDLTAPTAPATRAQAAELLYQLLDVTNLFWCEQM